MKIAKFRGVQLNAPTDCCPLKAENLQEAGSRCLTYGHILDGSEVGVGAAAVALARDIDVALPVDRYCSSLVVAFARPIVRIKPQLIPLVIIGNSDIVPLIAPYTARDIY